MKNKSDLVFFDWVFIILNITFHLSIVKVFTFDLLPIPPIISLFGFNLLSLLFRWKGNLSFLIEARRSVLLLLLFLIYVFDIVQNLFNNPESAISRFFTLMSVFLFCSYLYNLAGKKKTYAESVFTITKPYILYGSYNVFIIILAGLLIFIGVLSPTSNLLSVNSLTKVDVGSGQAYYFPGYISIVTESFRVLADWGIPMITGLSHEPHVVNYIVLPSLFFLICIDKMQKWRLLIYSAYVIELFLAYSTTAVACLGFIIVIDAIWSFSIGKNITSLIPLVLVVLIVVFGYGGTFFNMISDEFVRKTVTETGSMEYSSEMLRYLTHPKSLFGAGNMPGSVGDLELKDVGAITFLLDTFFYLVLIVSIFRMVISRDKRFHYVGLACLYVALHSLKVSFLAFNYPYFVFIVFIVAFSIPHLRLSPKN